MLRARHGYPPGQAAWHTSRAALHKGLSELVGKPESNCKALRWHSWRRFGVPSGGAHEQHRALGRLGNTQHAQSLRLSTKKNSFPIVLYSCGPFYTKNQLGCPLSSLKKALAQVTWKFFRFHHLVQLAQTFCT